MPLGHELNRDGSEWIRIDLAVPWVGDADVETTPAPIRGIDESSDVDPVAHVLEIKVGHGRIDREVESGRPREADDADGQGGQGGAARPQLLEDRVQADRGEQIGRGNEAAAAQHVRGSIRQGDDQRENAEPEEQQGVAALAPSLESDDDPGKEGKPYYRIEQRQVGNVVLALGIAPEVAGRDRTQGVTGNPP